MINQMTNIDLSAPSMNTYLIAYNTRVRMYLVAKRMKHKRARKYLRPLISSSR